MSDDAGREQPDASDPAPDPRGSTHPSPDTDDGPPDEPAGAAERPRRRSLLVRAATAAVAVLALLLMVPFVVRLFVPPINPAQKTPTGHYASQCGWCHDMSDSAKLAGD